MPHTVCRSAPVILILAIHRTLSSCLAECLEKLGVSMGTRTKGGEDQALARFCEEVLPFPSTDLQTMGISYRGRPCLRRQWFRQWIEANGQRANGRPLGMKYPHLCALARELADAHPKLKVITLERRFGDSVRSLADRAATDPALTTRSSSPRRLGLESSSTSLAARRSLLGPPGFEPGSCRL